MEHSLTIYKASAGSGKTFALAVEYITGLLEPHAEREFEHTLAVTFTNKATAEMKNRILETLYGLKMKLPETRPYLEAIMTRMAERGRATSTELVSQQAGRALQAILHDYSHFRVETIDSFFQSILRGMARELGLAANLQVELSHEEIIDTAVDSLIDSMDTRPEVKKWVLDHVREQLDSGDKWDIIRPLKAFAGNIFREEYQQRSEEELRRISNPETVGAFRNKMQAIRKQAEREIQEAVDEVTNITGDFSLVKYGSNLLSFLTKVRAFKADGPGKSVEQIRFKKPNGREAEAQEAYARLLSLYPSRRKDYFSATLALRHLSSLLLLEYIDERAREIEGDAGRFTLSSTPALLSKMIEGYDAPFVFEKTGTFVNNVMIDEFQDTSRMQWENFKTLLFEKLSSGGKGLLVGDIKQSIYRWRGGDWKILYGVEQEQELQRFDIRSKALDVNYRSHQAVVDFNNSFFPPAARLLDGISPDADIKLSRIYADVEQKKRKNDGLGFVGVRLFKETEDEVESTVRDMADRIITLQATGIDLSQMAILVRTNRMAQQLIDGFGRFAPDIRLVSEEAFLLDASVSVQMIVAAMRVLIDKQHSDLISEKYLMLHYLTDVCGKAEVSIQDIALMDMAEALPEAFTQHLDELAGLPLYLLAERLWRIFQLDAIRGEEVYVLTFLDELQKHLQGAGAPDVATFLTAWDEKLHQHAVPGSSVAGVRILTIHKSKGLEFHTVFLPFCHWKLEEDRQESILWCKTDDERFGDLGALPISILPKGVRTSAFASDYYEEHLERRVDALNTLYVAFTRAKANLFIWGKTQPADKIKNLKTAGELIYLSLRNEENDKDDACFYYEVGRIGTEESPLPAPPLGECRIAAEGEGCIGAGREKPTSGDYPHQPKGSGTEALPQRGSGEGAECRNRLRLEHRAEDAVAVRIATRDPSLRFRQSNQAGEFLRQARGEETSLSQREMGKRMHEVLSRVEDVSQLDDVLRQARQEGIIGTGKEWEAVVERITEGFRSPLVASWFEAGNMVYNECAIASRGGTDGLARVLRPDRVVMTDTTVTVVDYKFGRPDRLYHQQVAAYMQLMHRMYPRHRVLGYLWYVMEGRTAQVDEFDPCAWND